LKSRVAGPIKFIELLAAALASMRNYKRIKEIGETHAELARAKMTVG